MMVGATEIESLRDVDELVDAFVGAGKEAETDPEKLRSAPHHTSVGRIDEVKASHPKTLTLRWNNPKLSVQTSCGSSILQKTLSKLTFPPRMGKVHQEHT